MKSSTFYASELLAGVAALLESLGFDTDAQAIARGMEAPYLFVHDADRYRAGASLFHPQWINNYLHSQGFHMTQDVLPKETAASFLRANAPALLMLNLQNRPTLAVFTGYADRRYSITPIKCGTSHTLSLTGASLKHRLPDEVTIYTLTACESRQVDFIPLLIESLQTLTNYQQDLLTLREQVLSRSDMPKYHTEILRALMVDMLPMAALAGDFSLGEELRLLNHDYRHLFISSGQQTVDLSERLPKSSIRNCITWIKEDILDRLFELGAPEELLDSLPMK